MSTRPHEEPGKRADGSGHAPYEHASDDESYDLRPSAELSDDDHDILESEDEREKLLTQRDGIAGLFGSAIKIGKRGGGAQQQQPEMKERKRSQNTEASALMYGLEEGVGGSSSSLLRSRRSSESDEQRLLASRAQKKSKKARVWRKVGIYSLIAAFFAALLGVAYRLSMPTSSKAAMTMVSNGTSLFAPTTILISLDGFRADFLFRNITPTLNQFVQEGISPKYMLPSFPSVTFPNHYTMATGMYPEAHGVVGNSFWDPATEKEFYYTDPERSLQPHWWGGEPIWVTAEKQNAKTAVHMWPGSEVHTEDMAVTYVDKYNGSEVLSRKIDRIMGLLDTPGPQDIGVKADTPRPQLIAAYVPNVDAHGHKYGPNSTEIRKTISSVDTMMGGIFSGLQERNLTNIVNVIVVSDHGMATTDVSRLIQLEDLVDPAELAHIDGWPLYGLRPKKLSDLDRLYNQIKEKAKDNPNIEVYLRDKDMPERYHFSKNDRIAPLWIVPKTGWAIVTKSEFDVEEGKKKGEVYHPRGLHGYDFEHPLMRAIFVARGPAFPHTPGSRMEPFQNINLYNIVCDSLGLIPAPNNGTLRLPLKPVGLHSDLESAPNETPSDPVEINTITSLFSSATASATPDSLSSITAPASSIDGNASSLKESAPTSTPGATTTASAPPAQSSPAEGSNWWDWITHKADELQEWVDDFVHKHVPGQEDKDGNDS